jgi:hypothetical protein
MRRFPLLAAVVAVASLLIAACSSTGQSPGWTSGPPASATTGACGTAPQPGNLPDWGPPATTPPVLPILINSGGELVCGENRVLFTFVDSSGRPVGAPDRSATIAVYDLGRDPATPTATVDGTFVWAIEGERGVYVANVTFPEAGAYGAEFRTAAGTGAASVRLTFDVQPTSSVVKVGQPAPASKTPTLADVGGDAAKISTDASPNPAFYQTSIDAALSSHDPFVVIFATPKFCVSAQCGPTLDRLKPYVSRYPSITFINVEPYRLKLVDGSLVAEEDANGLIPTETTVQWGLLSEPWVFVVDRGGIVRGSFELIFSDAELTAALDAVR